MSSARLGAFVVCACCRPDHVKVMLFVTMRVLSLPLMCSRNAANSVQARVEALSSTGRAVERLMDRFRNWQVRTLLPPPPPPPFLSALRRVCCRVAETSCRCAQMHTAVPTLRTRCMDDLSWLQRSCARGCYAEEHFGTTE